MAIRTADGRVERQEVPNPHWGTETARGLHVTEWLVSLKVDTVLLRTDIRGQGPAHEFGDAGTEMRVANAISLDRVPSKPVEDPSASGILKTSDLMPV